MVVAKEEDQQAIFHVVDTVMDKTHVYMYLHVHILYLFACLYIYIY